MTELCTARVTKCGGALVVTIPHKKHDFREDFPHGTLVVISKARIDIVRTEE